MSAVLVSGTLALDHIANVTAGFEAGNLNGKLEVVTQHFGGCGMNLAYGLARAGQAVLPWVSYGADCPPSYLAHMATLGLQLEALDCQPGALCAAAYIFTRPDGTQLTGFYPGSTTYNPPDAALRARLATCAAWLAGPEPDATLLARLTAVPAEIALWWMPGQYTEILQSDTLLAMIRRTRVLIVNTAEWNVLQQRLPASELANLAELYVTCGADGVRYGQPQHLLHSHGAPATVVDPTGCGDAFCATLAAARLRGVSAADAVASAQESARRCLSLAGSQRY